jgi:uncharacterized protein (TIGR02466 family)
MPIQLLFPTPIYIDFVNDSLLKSCQLEVDNEIKNYTHIDLQNPWGDTVQTSFKYNQDVAFLNKTPIIQAEITKHLNNFIKNMDLKYSVEINESWFNISSKNQYQHFHVHDTYDFSGVYYHQTNSADGDIVFANPSLASRMSKLTGKPFGTTKISPKPGMIIIFPSYLEHAVYQNMTENTRISITFNGKLL